MSNPVAPVTYWQELAMAAENGQLFLNSDAARACDSACVAYISKLRDHQRTARGLSLVDGWGEFESGKALRKIYADKAVGGENNMVDVLQSHVEVVQQMQAVFKKFFVDTGATDDGNAADLGNQGPK